MSRSEKVEALGAVLVAAGTTLVYYPAGIICAGLFCLGYGLTR